MRTSLLTNFPSRAFAAMLALIFTTAASLIAQEGSPAKNGKAERTLGILLFPGFELLDATGPLEMWGNLKGQVKIVTIARQKGEIPCSDGPKMVADVTLDDAPPLDLVLVPGGSGVQKVLQEKDTLDWLRARSAKAELTMSVCNGASILAATGLLNGRPATTNKMYWNWGHRRRPRGQMGPPRPLGR